MALPEEDNPQPAWLRDWQHIEADIQAMGDFAQKLRTDVEKNYISHLTPIYDNMTTRLPAIPAGFPELVGLLETHRAATDATTTNVHDYANHSAHLAQAASTISTNYRDSDAFARATVGSVERALDRAGATGVAPGAGSGAGSTPTDGAPVGEGH